MSYESDNEGYKTPIVQFKTLDGKEIQKQPYYYSFTDLGKIRTYENKINKTIIITYDSKYPEVFTIKNEQAFNHVAYFFLIVVSLAFIIIGVLNFLGYINFS